MELSFEAVHSDEVPKKGSGKGTSTVTTTLRRDSSHEPARSDEKPRKKKGGDGSGDSVDSDEVTQRLIIAGRVQQGVGDDGKPVYADPTFEYILGSGLGSREVEHDDDSEQVRLSEERGPVKKDIALIFEAIEKFGAYKYEGQPLDKEYRDKIIALSKDRLQAVANYAIWNKNHTLLHNAARIGDHEILRLLLENGASGFVDYANDDGYTPLILAVDACDQEAIQILLKHSQSKQDALCAAIEFYERAKKDEEEEENEQEKQVKKRDVIDRQKLLDWLISLPEISGKKRVAKNPVVPSCYNNVSCSLPLSDLQLTAFQLLCLYKDKVYFDKLLEALPENLDKKSDSKGNTFLHLSVCGANPENKTHLDLIAKVIAIQKPKENQIPWVTELNHEKKTVLDIACEEQAYPIIELLAANGAKLIPDHERLNKKSTYVSPLHRAIITSDLRMLNYLFEKFAAETESIFQYESSRALLQANDADVADKKDILDELFNHALEAWRNKVLTQEDNAVQLEILRELLKRDTDERIFNSLFRETERKIYTNIKDEGIRKSLSDLCSKVHSDYCLVNHQNNPVATELKLKALCLVSSIEKVADSYSKQKDPTVAQKEEATKNFILCLRYLLFSNTWKTWAGIAVCALIGMVVGAVVGFIVGQLLSGGVGGGFVLGPPTAEYGWAVGTIVGCIIFGVGLAGARYLLSDLFKSHMSLWAISKAMRHNINSHDDKAVKKDNSSPRETASSEGVHQEFGVTEREFSFDGDGDNVRLVDSLAN